MADEVMVKGIDGPATDQLAGLDHKEYQHWQRTGELPQAASEAPPASPAPVGAEPAAPAEPAAAASEPAKPPEKVEKRSSAAERRIKELLGRIKELEAAKPEPPPAVAVSAPAAVRVEEKLAEKPAEVQGQSLRDKLAQIEQEFKDGKFASYEAYTDAKIDARSDYRIEERLASAKANEEKTRVAAEKAATDKTQREAAEALSSRFTASCDLARTVHDDFDTVVGNIFDSSGKLIGARRGSIVDKAVLPGGSVPEAWILESEVGTELMYYLGDHLDELKAILKLNPFAQSRALTKLELKLNPEKPTEAPPAPAPVKPKSTQTPPPPRELGAGRLPPGDEVDRAVREGDVGAYITAANRRATEEARARRG